MQKHNASECGLAVLELITLSKRSRALLTQRLQYTLEALSDMVMYIQSDRKVFDHADPFAKWLVTSRWSHRNVTPKDHRTLRELFFGSIPHAQDADGFCRLFRYYHLPKQLNTVEALQYIAKSLPLEVEVA